MASYRLVALVRDGTRVTTEFEDSGGLTQDQIADHLTNQMSAGDMPGLRFGNLGPVVDSTSPGMPIGTHLVVNIGLIEWLVVSLDEAP